MQQNSQTGFSVVELLITLFVAVAFVATGYQLYSVIVADGGEARFRARASNLAYEELRKATALTPTCSTTTASTILPATSGHGIDTPTITRTLSAPQGCNGSTWSDRIMRVEITVAYGPSTERQEVKHALYVAK